jgi:hypothetical protein
VVARGVEALIRSSPPPPSYCIAEPELLNFEGAQESIPRNQFLTGRYDNPIPTRFLAPTYCLKIPALPSGLIFKDDVNGFSSQKDICCMDIYDAGGYDGVSWGAAIRPGNLIFIRAL